MIFRTFFALTVSLLAFAPTGTRAQVPDASLEGTRAPVAPMPRRCYPLSLMNFSGVVTALDDKSVSIRGFDVLSVIQTFGRNDSDDTGAVQIVTGKMAAEFLDNGTFFCTKLVRTRAVMILTTPAGTIEFRRDDQPVHQFQFTEALLKGERGCHGNGFTDPRYYPVRDVRVGDEVEIYLHRGRCSAIIIERRPGGRVPVSSGLKLDESDNHAERMNAFQDFEERGIPLPKRFRKMTPEEIEAKLQEMRKRPPLEEWIKQEQERNARKASPPAPMPREVKPKP